MLKILKIKYDYKTLESKPFIFGCLFRLTSFSFSKKTIIYFSFNLS